MRRARGVCQEDWRDQLKLVRKRRGPALTRGLASLMSKLEEQIDL
jgi:hypothetical protein